MIQSTAVREGFLVLRWFLDAIWKVHIFGLVVFFLSENSSFTYRNPHLSTSAGINHLILSLSACQKFQARNNQELVSASCLIDWAAKPTALVQVRELLLKNWEHHPPIYLISFGSMNSCSIPGPSLNPVYGSQAVHWCLVIMLILDDAFH